MGAECYCSLRYLPTNCISITKENSVTRWSRLTLPVLGCVDFPCLPMRRTKVFLPKVHPRSTQQDTLDRGRLRDIQENESPELFRIVNSLEL